MRTDALCDAVAIASEETGLDTFPETFPWDLAGTQAPDWLPE